MVTKLCTLGSISKTARRCGIPRSTLYRWIHRYNKKGKVGLVDKSQKPKRLAKQKVDENLKKLILEVRQNYKFGPQRISYLFAKRASNSIIDSYYLAYFKAAGSEPT